jgi:uncharacterized protein
MAGHRRLYDGCGDNRVRRSAWIVKGSAMLRLMALLAGTLFGCGLTISGMANPQKVLGFLDFAAIRTGGWDPTLLLVFVGALPVMFVAYRLQAGAARPWFANAFQIPADGLVSRPLVLGSTLFGIGWGLAGLCPGPAVIALALASKPMLGAALLFFGALLAGIWVATVTRGLWER